MSLLETGQAPEIIRMLEKGQDNGSQYIVLEMYRPMDAQLKPHDLKLFKTLDNALDYLDEKEGHEYVLGGEEHPCYYQSINKFLEEIKLANSLTELTPIVRNDLTINNQLNSKTMNLNNLHDLKSEVRELGFSTKIADELEPNVKSQASYFTLKDRLPGDNNNGIDMTLHFRKSNESEYYSFNKFEAVAGKIPPAVENQQYMVLTENKDNPERPLVREFESGTEAVEFFKKQKGTSELALGESPESRQLLASKETGKVNYVNPDFKQAYFSSAIKQTFYVKNGIGFSALQAANMVQHRTVHRDNMLNPNNGEAYKAWISLDFDQKKDDYGNYKFKQMNDPNFGFNLEKTLDNFKIKELADPAKKEAIMEAMKNGDRLHLTITGKDNKEHTVQVEAVPRYKTLDFYNSKGEKMKREPFLKPAINKDLGKDKGKGKGKDEGEDLGIAV